MTDGPWSEGWPKGIFVNALGQPSIGNSSRQDPIEVVPLSDAERLREERDRYRKALERIGKGGGGRVGEAAYKRETARAALSQPVSKRQSVDGEPLDLDNDQPVSNEEEK